MLNGYMLAKDAAKYLTEKAGRDISVDDLRQMRRHGHIEGTKINYNVVVFTQEQLEAATIPPERKPSEQKKKRRKRRRRAVT